jgi:hypothetical protein
MMSAEIWPRLKAGDVRTATHFKIMSVKQRALADDLA